MYRYRLLPYWRCLLLSLFFAAGLSFTVSAATDLIIFVNPAEANSFRFIDSPEEYTYEAADLQAALDAAEQLYLNQQESNPYAEVRLGYGTYYATFDSDPAVSLRMHDNVRIIGGFSAHQTAAGIEPERAQESVISGNIGDASLATDNTQRLFSNEGISATAQLHYVRLSGSYNTSKKGGGMYNKKSHPTLIGCIFSNNQAQMGGALFNDQSSPILTACTFSSNSASMNGGAIAASFSSSTFSDCTFDHNTITGLGIGAALDLSLSSMTLETCHFEDNRAPNGGAISSSNSTLMLRSCRFIDNQAVTSGAALFSNADKLIFDRCRFQGNRGAKNGSLLYITSAKQPPLILGSAFYRNSSTQGHLLTFDASSPSLANCLFTANDAGTNSLLSFLGVAGPSLLNCSFSGNTSSIISNAHQLQLINTLVSGNASDHMELAVNGQIVLQGGNIIGSLVYQEEEPMIDAFFDPALHLAATAEDAAIIELIEEDNAAIDAGSDRLYDELSSIWQSIYGFDSDKDIIGHPRKQRQIDIGAVEYALPFVTPQLTLIECQRLNENEAQLSFQSNRAVDFCYAVVPAGKEYPLDATNDFVYRAEADEAITLLLPIDREAWTILVLARSGRGMLSEMLSAEIAALPIPIAPTINLLSYGRLNENEAEAFFKADRAIDYAYALTENATGSPLHIASEFTYRAEANQTEHLRFQLGAKAATLHILALDDDSLLSNELSATIEAYRAPEDPPPEDPSPTKPSQSAPLRPNPLSKPSDGDDKNNQREEDPIKPVEAPLRLENYLQQLDQETWRLQLSDGFSEHIAPSDQPYSLCIPEYAELLIAKEVLGFLCDENLAFTLRYPAFDIAFSVEALAFLTDVVEEELSVRLKKLPFHQLPPNQPSGECLAAFQLDLSSENEAIHNITGMVRLHIVVSPAFDGTLQAWCYSDAGGWEILDMDYDESSNLIVLHPDHFSVFAFFASETMTAALEEPVTVNEHESKRDEKESEPSASVWHNPFADLNEDYPHYDSIAIVHQRGWMVGIAEDCFAADAPLQRGMLAVILSRIASADLTNIVNGGFNDLFADDYYSPAALWAWQQDIMEVTSPYTFAARDTVDGSELQYSLKRLKEKFGIEIAYTAPPAPQLTEKAGESSTPISRGEMASILSGISKPGG